uniref:Uncharacterized protein n=1 Tax=Oryza sativa subsp. japonica TaxID=39947 RepID=H2KX22_ORYSJ|nr:hypothetical protein LOC_Os12g42284 [Oryza sativa Japonica Group]
MRGGSRSGASKAGSGHPTPRSGATAARGGWGAAAAAAQRRRGRPGAAAWARWWQLDGWDGGSLEAVAAGSGGGSTACPVRLPGRGGWEAAARRAAGPGCPGSRGSAVRPNGSPWRGSAVSREPPWRGQASAAGQAGCRRSAFLGRVGCAARPDGARRPGDGGAGGLCRSRSSSSFTGVGASPDGSVKGVGGGGSSSPLPVGTLALPGAPPLLCGEFLGWIEAATRQRGKPRLPKQCHPVPGSPFVQSWRGGRRVVERRGPGPALRGGG